MTSIQHFKNILTAFAITSLIVGWDVAHSPKVNAGPVLDVESSTPRPGEVGGPALILSIETTIGTPIPTPKPTKDIVVKISHYSPSLGGVNCGHFVNGKCVSRLANGESWEKYINTKSVIACPPELKLGTQIKILGRVWTCRDRGGKITTTATGAYWIDMLTEDTVVAFGTEIKAEILN